MGLIDFILNLAALLLWLSWSAVRLDPLTRASAATLIGTLRRTGPAPTARRKFLGALAALLFVRAVLYWQLGQAIGWTPELRLGVISIPLRSEFFVRMLLFSVLSFAFTLGIFYLCLLLLSILHGGVADASPAYHRWVRLHLGRIDRWPGAVKAVLPFFAVVALWLALAPLLARSGIVPHATSGAARFQQALLIGVATYLSWKYLIAGLLLLHVLNGHVYLGNHPFWSYVNATARKLLAPLRPLPLRAGRMDFAPVVGIALVFLIAEFTSRWLAQFYPL
jgi:uncharacterized protein YggT (Ycf19 family)